MTRPRRSLGFRCLAVEPVLWVCLTATVVVLTARVLRMVDGPGLTPAVLTIAYLLVAGIVVGAGHRLPRRARAFEHHLRTRFIAAGGTPFTLLPLPVRRLKDEAEDRTPLQLKWWRDLREDFMLAPGVHARRLIAAWATAAGIYLQAGPAQPAMALPAANHCSRLTS